MISANSAQKKYARKTAHVEIMTVTPALAAEMLLCNTNNRPVNFKQLDKLVVALSDDEFKLTGAAIKFSKSGVLVDGQHRLEACVATGVPFQTVVVRGVDDDSYKYLGDQLARKTSGEFKRLGYPNPVMLSSAALMLWSFFEDGDFRNIGRANLSTYKVVDFVRHEHPQLSDCVNTVQPLSKNNPPSVAPPSSGGLLLYLCSTVDPDLAQLYVERLYTGLELRRDDPEYLVRRKLLAMDPALRSSGGHAARKRILTYLIQGWNMVYNGITTTRLPKLDDVPPIAGWKYDGK